MKAISHLKSRNSPQLIPIFKKPERRLLSVLMSVLDIVPEFRGELLSQCGYGSGKTCSYQSFMEPHFESRNLTNRIPDGLIVCSRGKTSWSALIEAKAEDNRIRPEQIQEYTDLANSLDIDAVISISNEYAVKPTELPYHLSGNKTRGREVFHLSWPEIRTAMSLFVDSATDSNDTELTVIRHALAFMQSDRSGVETYDAMTKDWAKFVEAANTALGFAPNTSGVMDVIHGWQQERRDLCTKLNSEVGSDVLLRHPSGRRSTPLECASFDKKLLADDYLLKAEYLLKESKCRLRITSDLRACSHSFGLQVNLPDDRKAKGTISWLVTKLSGLPTDKYKVGIDWPGRGNKFLVNLDQLVRYPEEFYEGQKDAPRIVVIIAGHRDVRRFKSRKRFIEDLEQNAIRLVQDATRTGILSN